MRNSPTAFDWSILQSFSSTFVSLKEQGILTPVMTLDGLKGSLNPAQREMVEQILQLKPKDYGIQTPYAGDIGKTIRHASPPTYSPHTIASKAAIDFKTIDGSPSDSNPEDFRNTVEYSWLKRHADAFSFHESWLKGSEFVCEPSHGIGNIWARTRLKAENDRLIYQSNLRAASRSELTPTFRLVWPFAILT